MANIGFSLQYGIIAETTQTRDGIVIPVGHILYVGTVGF